MSEKILRLPQVKAMVGLGKTAIYDKIKEGAFPKPIKLGRASGWLEGEVQQWIGKQVEAQRGEGVPA
ncbi:AlpA family transcriptional regulator [Pandoraea sp. CB10b_02]|uniref:helix-turn-helix transcriptional regulator n=1 Tax=Pandoraea sp. CB10b_02 TaxID=2014535 RepID=UPI00257BA0B8|nr:AlpA family transcriptional regulator [Pandoraea sp. CB10b_02]